MQFLYHWRHLGSTQACIYAHKYIENQIEQNRTSLVALLVKTPPAMWETWIRLLGWEDPLEEGMATYSSILAWRISWTKEPGGLQSMVSQRVRHDTME